MKIALLGYGRMGQAIEKVALERNHEIVIKKDVEPIDMDLSIADVAIDFSHPLAAFDNIKECIDHGVPVVSGTTGWLDKYDEELPDANEWTTCIRLPIQRDIRLKESFDNIRAELLLFLNRLRRIEIIGQLTSSVNHGQSHIS